MRVPRWVVTFNFLRPFMSKTHQPRKLPSLYYTRPRATPPGAATIYSTNQNYMLYIVSFYVPQGTFMYFFYICLRSFFFGRKVSDPYFYFFDFVYFSTHVQCRHKFQIQCFYNVNVFYALFLSSLPFFILELFQQALLLAKLIKWFISVYIMVRVNTRF